MERNSLTTLQSVMILSILKSILLMIQVLLSSQLREQVLFSLKNLLCIHSSCQVLNLRNSSVLEKEKEASGYKITLNTQCSQIAMTYLTLSKQMARLSNSQRMDSSLLSTVNF